MNYCKQSEELYQRLEQLTQEDINNLFSYRAVYEYLNLKEYPSGKGFAGQKLVKKYIDNNFNVRHFTGQAWNKNNFDYQRFQKNKVIKSALMKQALVNLRGNKCERCGMSKWFNEDISLEVHHIDGDNLNNEMNNLLLLCPNCHAQTDNWRGKNINQGTTKVSDEELKVALSETDNIRQALIKVGLSPKGGNYNRAYELKAKYNL